MATILSRRYTVPSTLVPKSTMWIREVLPALDEKRFKQMLRVNRQQFSVIISLIENHAVFHGDGSSRQLPVSTQLAITLFRLGSSGTGASTSKISTLFGLGDGGTIHRTTKRVIQVRL